ncbi:MAG: Rrf2 family transcriptional regulator [Syntrophomonadaceae bacterium]|nr:Rrf2 family transcriptional regulator [Syntrophomonadaceae bacterium]
MQLSRRFPVALQMLIIMDWAGDKAKITSEILALSVNTNPVLIRRIMTTLKKAGLITVAAGTGGAKLALPATAITLLDVYRAVELTANDTLFGLHPAPNTHCPIGSRINKVLAPHLENARHALESSLGGVSVAELTRQFPEFKPALARAVQERMAQPRDE